jgi:hypothetical protein
MIPNRTDFFVTVVKSKEFAVGSEPRDYARITDSGG